VVSHLGLIAFPEHLDKTVFELQKRCKALSIVRMLLCSFLPWLGSFIGGCREDNGGGVCLDVALRIVVRNVCLRQIGVWRDSVEYAVGGEDTSGRYMLENILSNGAH